MYIISSKYKINGSIYILCQTHNNEVCLINIYSGSRWTNSIKCKINVSHNLTLSISQDIFDELCGRSIGEFELITDMKLQDEIVNIF